MAQLFPGSGASGFASAVRMAVVSGLSAILIANVLIPLAIAIFSSGFFPYKPLVSGLAKCEDLEQYVKPPFDKVIFMVVDALRRYGCSNHS